MGSDIHSQINSFRNDLRNDLIKYKNNIGRHIAQAISKELTDYAKSVIKDFYDDYNPRDPKTHSERFHYKDNVGGTHYRRFYYKRHGNFNNVPQEYYKKRGEYFIGGVDLNADLPDVYWGSYSAPDEVFNRVIVAGLHGFASLGMPHTIQVIPPIFKPSPYVRIKEKYDEIVKNPSKYEKDAVAEAKKDNYIMLFR